MARKFYFGMLVLAFVLSISAQDTVGVPVDSDWVDSEEMLESVPEPVIESASAPEEPAPEPTMLGKFNSGLFSILFFDIAFGTIQIDIVEADGTPVLDETGQPKTNTIGIPFVVALLFLGGVFYTFYYKWINVRAFKHAIDVVRGKYDDPKDTGEISHFKALTSALSATVGLGNIAGVAIAIQLGGPGAVFWMLACALVGMTSKFHECTLAQIYRKTNPDGSISGGPMYYLDIGLKKLGTGWGRFGKFLGILFAFMVMGGALGGGNMFQINQTVESISTTFNLDQSKSGLGIGIVVAIFVAAVILGGIKRIGNATSRLVPMMVVTYMTAAMYIIIVNISQIPAAIALVFKMAFSDNAFYGGIVGVMVWGIKRAAFSNEAGLGSASIAHAAAKTDEPVREGIVALLEPFIDTVIVCMMTASVVIVTGAWNDPNIPQSAGVSLTNAAFSKEISWFPYILTACVVLFAYSTMISWCYYGERGWIYLLDHFGKGTGYRTVTIFRVIFIAFILFGAINKLGDVLDFSDGMILGMALPNILGGILMAPLVKMAVNDYWKRLKSGDMALNRK